MVNLTFGALSTSLNSDSVGTAEKPPVEASAKASTEQTPPESQQTETQEKPSVEATTEGSAEEKSPIDGFFEYLDKNPEAKEQVLQKLGEIFKKDS